jgi:peptidoglycan hydrolase-like protein with peptidoglycan-binding domain
MAIYLQLREGDQGALTRYLQVLLCAHENPTLIADGWFWEGTRAAVVAFQSVQKLRPDGVVDRRTWDALHQFLLPQFPFSRCPPPCSYPLEFQIRVGDFGAIVCQLQTLLRTHYSNVIVNGCFRARDVELVKRFQHKHGLPSTGIVNIETWALLCRKILHFGDTGGKVRDLQMWLRQHGYILLINGIFDETTLIAVMDFQQKFGLPVDGLVGLMTWVVLTEAAPALPCSIQLTKLHLSYTHLHQLQKAQSLPYPALSPVLTVQIDRPVDPARPRVN